MELLDNPHSKKSRGERRTIHAFYKSENLYNSFIFLYVSFLQITELTVFSRHFRHFFVFYFLEHHLPVRLCFYLSLVGFIYSFHNKSEHSELYITA
jgi:hypothetical protein